MKPKRERRPTKLGRYELVREIGRGGMGVIFEGRDPTHGRRVAVKVLPKQGSSSDERVRRFQREVQTIAMLSHRGIVRIFDVAEDTGRYYYVMEFIEGQSLKDAGEGHQMPLRRALEVIAQMCDALQHAHDQGVIHRDVNPNNILLDGDGRAVLIDFGIAKLADTSRLTRAGATIGTPRYLSPEQALGEPDVDGRTDVYGLGATLYLLATARPPFADEGGQTVSLTAIEKGPTAPRAMNARVPKEVDALIRKAMARRREDRYDDPASMAEDIRHYLETGTLAIAQPRALPKPVLIGLASALVLVVGGGIVAMFGWGGGEAPPPGPTPATDGAEAPMPGVDPGMRLPTVARDPKRAAELLATADQLRADGEHAEAVRTYFEALQEGAAKGDVLLGRAESNAALGKWGLAIEDWRELRGLETHAGRADQLARRLVPGAVGDRLEAGDVDALIPLLDEWLTLDPDAAAKFDWTLRRAGELAKGYAAIATLTDAWPTSPTAAFLAGVHALQVEQDLRRAASHAERLMTRAPTFASGLRLVAGVRLRSGDAAGAVEALRNARYIARDLTELDADIAVAEGAAGYPKESERAVARLVERAQSAGLGVLEAERTAYVAVARAWELWGDWLAAGHALELAVARAQLDGDALQADVLTGERKRLALAWQALDASALSNDNDRAFRDALGVVGDSDATVEARRTALAALDAAIAADPYRLTAAAVEGARASALLAVGDRVAARAAVQRGLDRLPRDRFLLEMWSWWELADGRGSAAADTMRQLWIPELRDREALSAEWFLDRVLRAADDGPGGGVGGWLVPIKKFPQEQRAILDRILAEIRKMMDRGVHAVPECTPVHAFAAAAAIAGQDRPAALRALSAAAASLETGAPAGADGLGPTRMARAIASLIESAAELDGVDAAGLRPGLLGCWQHAAVWNGDSVDQGARRGVWQALAKAALAAGAPGRAYQAWQQAQELGAKGGGFGKLGDLITEALSAVDAPETAHDMWQFGIYRRYRDPRGARETIRRAFGARDDGTLLPAERQALQDLWDDVR